MNERKNNIAGPPLVSVVVRTCNRPGLLKTALASILSQTWDPIEIVLVNDGREPVQRVVEELSAGDKIRLIEHESPQGRSRAANKGLEHAEGDYICFLDDDDLFLPGHVASLVSVLEDERSVDVAYTGVQCINEAGETIEDEFNDPFDAVRLRSGNYIPFNAVLFRRTLLDKGIKIDESIDLYEDWDFLLQMLDHTSFVHIDGKTALYRIADASGFGKSRDTEKVEQSTCLVLDKWRGRWPSKDLREMTKRSWQFGTLERLHTACLDREMNYQEQLKGYHGREQSYQTQLKGYGDRETAYQEQLTGHREREQSYQEQLKGHRNRETSYQKQLKDYHDREDSYQKQLSGHREREQAYQVQLRTLESLVREHIEKEKKYRAQLSYLQQTKQVLDDVLASQSWRITAPLRSAKMRLRMSPFYRVISKLRRRPEAKPEDTPSTRTVSEAEEKLYHYTGVEMPVPALKQPPSQRPDVKILAFYLPQFHAIPENDEWWGKGFTEWTNVRPALPQFDGHYQPHVPSDLGYYDLLDNTVWQQQVEMAKTYGIGGFCFYFYWFAGKRLLEQPLLNYLADTSLDFPFCLAWANENWSRRWDGLDNEILIQQEHSADDDLDFIAYLSEYLKDDRYIRINGRPVVIVYRPSLLPSAKATANRWRRWCRENHIGEIFLAYVQSFEQADPKAYDFDAAVEFPPNNSAPPNITKSIPNPKEGFQGTVFDWRILPERSYAYEQPGYKLFRGVNPSWDNTARKKQKGTIFVHSSPFGYLQWLYNALADTLGHATTPDERIVFVNAWNEWAEGAHLEPDQRYGYAYLEATRMALCRAGLVFGRDRNRKEKTKPRDTTTLPQKEIAVIIHAFYPDVFKEIVEKIRRIDIPYKVFVTTPESGEKTVRQVLETLNRPFEVLVVENHGRDVLPFLKIIPRVAAQGFKFFVKVHTKKSTHRQDGDTWRNDLYDKLLDKEKIAAMRRACEANPDIGLVGPDNHIVHMTTYLGSNRDRIKWYGERMGLTMDEVLEIPFVAGTMFFARMDAIMPLLSLAIREDEFEKEAGQVDGTLAHTIERLFSVSTVAAGFRIIDTGALNLENSAGPKVNKDYAFVN